MIQFLNKVIVMMLLFINIAPIGSVYAESVQNQDDSATTMNLNEGLIGHWDFNEGQLVNQVDETKNGRLVGDGISFKETNLGQSLFFEGDRNSYMEVPEFMNSAQSSYSISMWYQSDQSSMNGKNMVLAQQSGSGRSLLLLTPDNKYRTFITAQNIDNKTQVDQSAWQHVTVSFDRENNEVLFYVNGELDNSETLNDNFVNSLTSLIIGRHKDVVEDPVAFKGLIDELKVYNRVVNEVEAKKLYKMKNPAISHQEDLIGYWNFDEGSVDSLVGDKKAELIGTNISIEESTMEEMGHSLKFDKGNDSYLKIPNFINTAANDYTFSMWYKTEDISTSQHTILLQQSGKGRTLLTARLDGSYGSYVTAQDIISNTKVDRGNWEHVAMSINRTDLELSYYINGELEGVYDLPDRFVDETTDLMVGLHKSPNLDQPQQMVGEIDELRVYDSVLDKQIIGSIYEDGFNEVIEREPVEMTVDSNQVLREVDDSIFGINHRYAFNGYGMFDPKEHKVREDFKSLYEDASFGSIRYPGGTISNLFRWKESIGPKENRKKQIHGFYNAAQGIEANFGLDEIGQFSDEMESEMVYVYGLGRGNAKDAADLIEYMNAEVGTNPNGGIEWAKVRESHGHKEPFNVRFIEIGNEMHQDYGGPNGDGSVSQAYWTQYGGSSLNRYIHGGEIIFNKQAVVEPENWNSSTHNSNGEKNQVKYMRYANIAPGIGSQSDEDFEKDTFTAVVEDSVKVYVNDKEWELVDDISVAGNKQAVEVNYFTGELLFGDGENGVIPSDNAPITVSYKVEKDGFIEVSKAIRETMDQINTLSGTNKEINVYSGYESQGFINQMENTNNNDLYDGLTIHPYSGTPNGSGENYYYSAMDLAEKNGIRPVQNYINMMPEGKVPVISEFGIFRSTDPLVRSQTHALYIAKVMMSYVEMGSPYIQKHTLVDWFSSGADALGPTQQAVIQAVPRENADTQTGEGDYDFFSTPSAHIFELFNTMFGNKIVENSLEKVYKIGLGTDVVNAMTSVDEKGNLYLALLNLDLDNPLKINVSDLNTDLKNKEIKIKELAGDSFDAENSLENPNNVSIKEREFLNETEKLELELSPHSFTIVKVNNRTNFETKALESLINDAKQLNSADYTEISYANLLDKIDEAENTLKVAKSQEEIDKIYNELTRAINDLINIEEIANEIMNLIDALPIISGLTLADKEDVEVVRAAYAELSEEVKSQVLNIYKLEELEIQLVNLQKATIAVEKAEANRTEKDLKAAEKLVEILKDSIAKTDLAERLHAIEIEAPEETEEEAKRAAVQVDRMIYRLPNVRVLTVENAPLVEAARSAYEGLSDLTKTHVRYLSNLVVRENRLAALSPEGEELYDEVAVLAVQRKIYRLPSARNITIADGEQIAAVRADYEELNEASKAEFSAQYLKNLEVREAKLKLLE